MKYAYNIEDLENKVGWSAYHINQPRIDVQIAQLHERMSFPNIFHLVS